MRSSVRRGKTFEWRPISPARTIPRGRGPTAFSAGPEARRGDVHALLRIPEQDAVRWAACPTPARPSGRTWSRIGTNTRACRTRRGTIQDLRSLSGLGTPLFLSEYGIGSAVDLWRVTRHFEQLGKTEVEDAQFYRDKLDRYLADWERWKLDELYARPEDFFGESLARWPASARSVQCDPLQPEHRRLQPHRHERPRQLRRRADDDLPRAEARHRGRPVRGLRPAAAVLFAEPANVYRGTRVRLEAVLANEDALAPGEYPARLLVVGPQNRSRFRKTVNVTIEQESPFVLPVFADDVAVDGPSGRYRFLAAFERGGAPTGGEAEFYVADPAEMPAVTTEVVLWGEDPGWPSGSGDHGIRVGRLRPREPATRK